ncbi:MAG: hypothetical protein Q7S14_02230 [bacterium]|nr:hypothetical protein [bacterium]
MLKKELIASFVKIAKDRISNGKNELLNNPVLEASIAAGPIAGRLQSIASVPAFYAYSKLAETFPTLDWRWISIGVVGLALITMSVTEYQAIKRRKYCTNTNTIGFNLALDNPVAGIGCSKVWSFVNMFNPLNPVELGMVTYLGVTGDWPTFLNFVAARNIVKTVYNSGGDILIATGKLDPLYKGIQEGKRRVKLLMSGQKNEPKN